MEKHKEKTKNAGIKVLLVDDHEEFRLTVKKFLKEKGADLHVSEAATGEDGVEQALRIKPDIVIADIGLPDISGIDAARQIKKALPKCKVIMLTMFESAAFRNIYDFHDMDGYIGKNELYEKLMPSIKNALEN
ncbi:MAG: response regulator transcription factor [Candidatus Omnitrophota bacterium]